MWRRLFGCGRGARIEAKLDTILERLNTMSIELDNLKAAVTAENTVIDSAVTLLQGLSAQIAALPADRAAITALATEVRTKSDALAAAIVANTPTP